MIRYCYKIQHQDFYEETANVLTNNESTNSFYYQQQNYCTTSELKFCLKLMCYCKANLYTPPPLQT